MLAHLSITNFVIIEELSFDFNEGLTVLTGETGAGKSIIIDAISLLVGSRSSSEFVRTGSDRAIIEGIFFLSGQAVNVTVLLDEHDIKVEEDTLILRREILANGKSICKINGKLVTLSFLRQVGNFLLDMHGQHDTQMLLEGSNYISLIDSLGNIDLTEYKKLFVEFKTKYKQLKDLELNDKEVSHRIDLLQFQVQEIAEADLKIGEEEDLAEQKNYYNNFEKINKFLSEAEHSLKKENGALESLVTAQSALESATRFDSNLASSLETFNNSYYIIEEVTNYISRYRNSLELDTNKLNEVEDRLNVIFKLKRKYGNTISDVLTFHSIISKELESLQNREDYYDKLVNELLLIEKKLKTEAKRISDIRKKNAEIITYKIHNELKELYMEKALFEINMLTDEKSYNIGDNNIKTYNYFETGIDTVEFLISTNPGEQVKPLNKIASGGELSRIMLAFKSLFTTQMGITSIIFDEVDTGVSGRVAQAMANKIYTLSKSSQVLCITHLAQVAAMADNHLYISKNQLDNKTITSIDRLTKDERINELSRMISGNEITQATKEHVTQMILSCEHFKKKIQ
ncbi:MAG: recombination protein RecN [Bacillales bacterium]|nr:recombination protein RecN [Bacillales bacterium]